LKSAAVPQIDIDAIVTHINNAVRRANNEEEVRVRVSSCIEEKILKPLSLHGVLGRYEYTLISGARVDALYGHVLIEYKAPGKLANQRGIQEAKEQLVNYIKEEAGNKAEYGRYLGIIISDKMAFVRYDPRGELWHLRGPYEIRRETVIKLIEAIMGLRRKPLDADHLFVDFGPKSQLTVKLVRALYGKAANLEKDSRAALLFEDWKRLFRQATGYDPEKLEELSKLAEEYEIKGSVNYDALIFSVHTYYALLLKLIVAELSYIYGGGKFYRSYIAELDDAYSRGGTGILKEILQELESGGIFRRFMSIENFLEGDYFSWYLDVLDDELADLIAELARRLADYEIATPQLEPESTRDLLKRLYQDLVPGDLRHRLGEYYTPDWLASYLLDEVGLSLENLLKMGEEDPLKPLELRVLDPACGSGTFLILYISRLRKYAEEHYQQEILASYVLKNVVGYDLNPLAVLAARTNYVMAIADMRTRIAGPIEIPVYLADSIMVEKRTTLAGNAYVLRTSAGEFQIPVSTVEKGLLPKVLAEMSRCLENRYSAGDFRKRLEAVFKLESTEADALVELYKKLLKLEEERKDKVWIAVIRNAFAPILKGRFDYVIGNPPWVNWENLPEEYREISRDLWGLYGLLEVRKTGGFKRDISMLFLARCFDLYLKDGGRLGFLMPFTVFKTQAGAGFRKFLAKRTKVHVIHDMVTLFPFEGAVNRTSAIVIEKAPAERMNEARHIVWCSEKPVATDKLLEDVLKETKRFELVMVPLDPKDPGSPWMQMTPKIAEAVRKILTGFQHYEAHEGIITALNQVYFVQIKEKMLDGNLIITNPPEPGQKKKVKQVEAIVEPDLVYPLIRGRDVKKWYVEFEDRYVILPHYYNRPIAPDDMKIKYPYTFAYLLQFKEELKKRSIKPFLSLREKIKKSKSKFEQLKAEEELETWFYRVDNIGTYTFAPYKVLWKYIAGAISGKATKFECAVMEPINSRYLGIKTPIPHEKLMLVSTSSCEEAYYIAGLLNSSPLRAIVASYVIETEISTHILDIVKLPKFDPKNELHRRISELSKKAHQLARCIHSSAKPDDCRSIHAERELREVEKELDRAVAQLFGLSEDEIGEFEKLLAILSGSEFADEEEIEIPEEPKVSVLNTLASPGTQSEIEVDVVNPSGDELEIRYELPWGNGSFRTVEGKKRIEIPPLNPGKYEGTLKYTWKGTEKKMKIVIEVSEVTGPRRRRTLEL
jgi:type II restriction/modification system DNA methylase subunit YeeA